MRLLLLIIFLYSFSVIVHTIKKFSMFSLCIIGFFVLDRWSNNQNRAFFLVESTKVPPILSTRYWVEHPHSFIKSTRNVFFLPVANKNLMSNPFYTNDDTHNGVSKSGKHSWGGRWLCHVATEKLGYPFKKFTGTFLVGSCKW